MNFRYYLAASVAGLTLATAMATPAVAQDTTSAVRGTVEADGQPVAGATVTVTHEPSGTVSRTVTGADGAFSANGLRVGGPFVVEVQADGFEGARVTDLFLQAGQPFRLPITLAASNDIIVTAGSLTGALETSNGPITALGRTEIEGVASINRDIRDLARRDPLVNMDLSNSRTIEIAGNNGRLNRFSVDGVQFSDDFGLNNGGLPTSRGPVPFDAIEQFSVKTAPFDIAEGDFQGGAINVVLASGTNRFRGRAFVSYTDDSLTGSRVRGNNVSLDFDSLQYGATLSGPIIRDTLFFMASYERTEETDPFDDGVGAGFANQIPNLTQAQIDQVSQIAQSVYGFDTLGQAQNANETDEKLVVKLDANIGDSHRASLTYMRSVGNQQFQQNTSTSTTSPTLGLFSNGYELTEEVNAGVFQLNSDWSDNFSTELRVSYRDYNRGQEPFGGRGIGQFEVCLEPTSVNSGTNTATSCASGTPRIFFGPDVSRHSNALNQDNLSIDLTARTEIGAHSLRFLAGYTDIDTYNLFLQRSLGDLYFDSIADFQARNANRLRLGGAVPSLDVDDAAAIFQTQNWTFGIQDDWQVTDALQVSLGLRYDLFNNPVIPPLNQNFVNRYGYSNRASFSGRGVFQPRFGFNWQATDRVIVRGGVGIFAGGTPDVFLSNSFSNTGLLTNSIDINRANCAGSGTCAGLNGVTGNNYPASVLNFLATNTTSLAVASTNAIDPDLDIANRMRAALSVDYEADLGPLGDGWMFGAQLLYDENLRGYTWTDVRSVAIGTLPDGRTRYGAFPGTTGTNQDLVMTNSYLGRGWFGSVRFERRLDNGLSFEGSYTRSDVRDEGALTSSTAGSLYSNNAFLDPNFAAYGRSIYEIRDTWKFGIDYRHAFFGDYTTRLSLFGEYRSGRPYSFTMTDNGSGRSSVFGTIGNLSRMLLYVPTANDTRVSFDSAASEAAFNTLVANYGLEGYRGRIVPKNSNRSPDFFRVDLHAEQQIPAFFGDARFTLFADIENVLNLIDSDWGALRQVGFPQTASAVLVQCLNTAVATGTTPTAAQINTNTSQPCVQYRYSSVREPNFTTVTRQSLYGIRVGVRFQF